MVNQPLIGQVALVTGATRGIGKGVALCLGEAGAIVYITGRTMSSTSGSGSLEETATEIRNRGGKCIPVQVDHENDKQVADLFQRISSEQDGRLDILVNNVYKAVTTIMDNSGLKFWEIKPEVWDDINNVGLRNHYFCTVYAARLMVPRKKGLIVNISSYGGTRYIFNVAYGVGKAALDRMAQDCGVELRKSNVACLSLYPGPVKTELVVDNLDKNKDNKEHKSNKIFEGAESVEFSGRCIVALAQDPNIMKYSSRVVLTAEYAKSHGILDVDNRVIPSPRQLNYLLPRFVLPERLAFVARLIPGFIKMPQFVLDILNSKF